MLILQPEVENITVGNDFCVWHFHGRLHTQAHTRKDALFMVKNTHGQLRGGVGGGGGGIRRMFSLLVHHWLARQNKHGSLRSKTMPTPVVHRLFSITLFYYSWGRRGPWGRVCVCDNWAQHGRSWGLPTDQGICASRWSSCSTQRKMENLPDVNGPGPTVGRNIL